MAEYIEREAVLADEITYCLPYSVGKAAGRVVVFAEDIEAIPAADVVSVVRCKDCRNGKPCRDGYVLCSHPAGKRLLMTSSDFCSYGEKRTGNEQQSVL